MPAYSIAICIMDGMGWERANGTCGRWAARQAWDERGAAVEVEVEAQWDTAGQ